MLYRYGRVVPTPQFPRFRLPQAAFAGCLAASALVGCQSSDLEALDVQSRSVDVFVTDHSAEGELEYRIWDMLDGTSKTTTHLRYPRPDMPRKGEVEVLLPEGVEYERGTYLRATGDFDADGRLLVDAVDMIAPPAEPIIDPEWYPLRRIATILVFWGQPGLTNSDAKSSMFLGNKSTHIFYGENSYGKENVIGEVFGPYEIPEPAGCSTGFLADAAQQAMIDKGHDPGDYIQFMYQYPFIGDCGFGGLASVGSPLAPAADSWYNGSFGCVVRNQEIGHNYGMGHSHAYNCSADTVVGDDCEHIEYGHPYDPMGGGCGHINNVQKTFMGWLEGCNIVTTPSNGTFNLMATELPCNGTQSLKIESSDPGRSYYLEYRQPIGAFDGIPGVLVHIAPTEFGGGPANYILDVGNNGFMSEGDSFTDPEGNVTITVLEEHEDHAVIDVSYADGGSGNPTCDGGEAPLMENGSVGSMECQADAHPGDITAPEVTITFPEDGAYFLPGSDFNIIAEASDDRVVADLELYVNGESFFKKLEEPWEYEVSNIPEGNYEFGIVARDGVNWTPSNAVNIIVTNDIPEMPAEDESGGEDDAMGTAGDGPLDGSTSSDESDDDTGDDAGAMDPAADSCACSTDGERKAPAALLFGLMIVGLRRRWL